MAVQAAQLNLVYSKNGVLNSGMTKAEINNSGNQKAIIEFNKANADGDEYLTPQEIAAYDAAQDKKSFWKKVAIGAAVLGGVAAVGYAIYKGLNPSKAVEEAKAVTEEAGAKLTETAEKAAQKAEQAAEQTALGWQQRATGYNLYERGVVGPGSKEVTDLAGNFHAGLDHAKPMTLAGQGIERPVDIEIVTKPTFQANRWKGFGTDYNLRPGDARMEYGEQPVSWMHERWKKLFGSKGIETAMDGAGSMRAPNGELILSKTYREVHPDGTIGEYLGDKLNVLGAKYQGVKDADMGIMIPTRGMKTILTSEGQRVAVTPGTYIAADELGIYAPEVGKVSKFFGKNVPMSDRAKEIAAKITEFETLKADAIAKAKDGAISGREKKDIIEKAWVELQKWSESLA